jgi:hypothetical protein
MLFNQSNFISSYILAMLVSPMAVFGRRIDVRGFESHLKHTLKILDQGGNSYGEK